MSNRPFPVRSVTAGSTLPAWLQKLREEQSQARRVRAVAIAYASASGGRVGARLPGATPAAGMSAELSLDEVNAALMDAAAAEFLASRSEAAFCQAGVVAPPDSLTGETRCDSGEGF